MQCSDPKTGILCAGCWLAGPAALLSHETHVSGVAHGRRLCFLLLSLCHRLHLLGHFQLGQYFVPLDKLLRQEHSLMVALKENTGGGRPEGLG